MSQRNTSVQLFGHVQKLPFVVAPTGLNGVLWPDGAVALARAARKAGIPFALSTAANATSEDVAERAGGDLWFQLYMCNARSRISSCDGPWTPAITR